MMEEKTFSKHGWVRALLFVICFWAFSILTIFTIDRLIGNSHQGKPTANVLNTLQNNMQGKFLLINFSISSLISILTVYGFRKLVDRKTLTSLGLKIRHHITHGATGFFLSIFLLGLGTFFLIANKNLQWTDIVFDADQLYIGFGLMFLVAFSEELVFRGYILNNLMQSMNKWLALALSALVFTMFHGNNPGITFVALLNVFFAGLLLGINYIYTKNLWFGILFHFSWNFYQGSILGYKVSGINFQSVLTQELFGNPILTGGAFGFEGSVIDGMLSIGTILLLAYVYNKRFALELRHEV